MLHKSDKDQRVATMYWIHQILERIILKRMKVITEKNRLIADHQFGFRSQQTIIHQAHRLVNNHRYMF